MYKDFNFLENKIIYMAPYNNLSRNLYKELKKYNINPLGFIDTYISGEDIYKKKDILIYDYIIIYSTQYWDEIAKDFNLSKIILAHTKVSNLIFYNDYLKYLESMYTLDFDIVFLAYNKSNVIDSSLVSRSLKELGYTSAIIITNHNDNVNAQLGLDENKDINTIHIDIIRYKKIKAIVCLVDWLDRNLINYFKQKNIPTIGLVDGVEDFEDSDYSIDRQAYKTVEYVLTCGKNDMKYLEYKKNKCFIVGLAKMYELWNSKITFPDKILIVINVNFTYGTFEEKREMWLEEVLEACKILNMNYIIAQHHADKGNLKHLQISTNNIYNTIKNATLVISRFSTVISESLALGKPVVYHNPHNEQVKLYKYPQGAFSISHDTKMLVDMIKYELQEKHNVRQRASEFLDAQFNILGKEKPAIMAANRIIDIIEKE